MSAFSTWARLRRPYGLPLVLFVAVACAITIAIAVSAHSGATSRRLTAAHGRASGRSVFVSHHPAKAYPVSNAGHGFNS
jgi:hypothetical protein